MRRMGSVERAERTILPLALACYHAVRDYPGSVAGCAAVYGWNAHTLQNKLNPTQGTHRLTADELEGILQLTRDQRILDSLAATAGVVWIDVQTDEQAGDAEIMQQIGEIASQMGTLAKDTAESLADRELNLDEISVLEKDVLRVVQSCYVLLARARLRCNHVHGVDHKAA